MLRRLAVALSLVLAAGCGYHLVGTSSFLPPELDTLHVAPFENATDWPEVDQRLNEEVVQEWVRRGRFTVVDADVPSQLVLRGTVVSVGVSPVSFDDQGRATEYQMTLTAAAGLYDVRGEEPELLWEDKAFSRRTSYQVDVSAADYFDRQVVAMEELARDFAQALVTAVLEGF